MVVYGDEEAKTHRSVRKEVSIIEKNNSDLDSSRLVDKQWGSCLKLSLHSSFKRIDEINKKIYWQKNQKAI